MRSQQVLQGGRRVVREDRPESDGVATPRPSTNLAYPVHGQDDLFGIERESHGGSYVAEFYRDMGGNERR